MDEFCESRCKGVADLAKGIAKAWEKVLDEAGGLVQPKLKTLSEHRPAALLEQAVFNRINTRTRKKRRDYDRLVGILWQKCLASPKFRNALVRGCSEAPDVAASGLAPEDAVDMLWRTLMPMDLVHSYNFGTPMSGEFLFDKFRDEDEEEDVAKNLAYVNKKKLKTVRAKKAAQAKRQKKKLIESSQSEASDSSHAPPPRNPGRSGGYLLG